MIELLKIFHIIFKTNFKVVLIITRVVQKEKAQSLSVRWSLEIFQ